MMQFDSRRMMATGSVVMALVVAFFVTMLTVAPKSSDPVELMRIAGALTGIVGAVATAMIIVGAVGRRTA